MRTPSSRRRDPNVPKVLVCGPGLNMNSNKPLTRVASYSDTVSVYGWPSRGGVIILEDATHVDFEFLGLSTTDPPLTLFSHTPITSLSSKGKGGDLPKSNLVDEANDAAETKPSETIQKDEDTFCQLLLLLGAKWWDSRKRNDFIDGFASDLEPYMIDVEDGKVAEPTPRERRWVKVGWEQPAVVSASASESESFKIGGFWILDRDNTWQYFDNEEDSLVPEDAGKVKLAKTMQERCIILKKMGATYYASLEDYESEMTFLKAWEWKWEGEVGPLRKVDFADSGASGSEERSDDDHHHHHEGQVPQHAETEEQQPRLFERLQRCAVQALNEFGIRF